MAEQPRPKPQPSSAEGTAKRVIGQLQSPGGRKAFAKAFFDELFRQVFDVEDGPDANAIDVEAEVTEVDEKKKENVP
jgi:hypothetical protein